MRHLKHHLLHLLMCAPMLLVAAIVIAGGSSYATLLFVLPCMLMMAFIRVTPPTAPSLRT